jgi:zinc protease
MKLRKIFAAVVLFLSAGTAMAQQMPAIPVDKNECRHREEKQKY